VDQGVDEETEILKFGPMSEAELREANCDHLAQTNGSSWVSQILVCVCCATAAFADPAPPLSPTNIFAPASTPAKSIFGLSLFVLTVTGVIFLVVFALLLYSVVKFRKRKNDDGREPPQVYGSNQVELAWTIIPILIVVALFMATARVIASVQKQARLDNAIEVVAVGHQFWWNTVIRGWVS